MVSLYQSSQLLTQYLSGKTYTHIRIERIFNDFLPAITVCSANFFSTTRISGFHPELDQLNEQYNKISKIMENLSNVPKFRSDLMSLELKIDKLHDNIIMNSSFDMRKIFNFTQPLKFDGYKLINTHIIGKFNFHDGNNRDLIMINLKENLFEYSGSPIESIYFLPKDKNSYRFKCFTYFSWLDEKWRNFKIDLDQIIFDFQRDRNLPFKYIFYIQIHSPNSLPELRRWPNLFYINPEQPITHKYHQIHIDLLGQKYDTNCFEYDLDYKFANNNMRSDCITHCYLDSKRQKCNSKGIIPSLYLLRSEYFFQDETSKFTDVCDDQDNVLNDCMAKCKNDCMFKYYLPEASGFQETNDEINVKIQHGQVPDINIEHLPEVTFVIFICNLGGFTWHVVWVIFTCDV